MGLNALAQSQTLRRAMCLRAHARSLFGAFSAFGVSVQRPIPFFGAVGLANWAKKGHLLWPSGAPDPGGIEAISRW
jgi:hypothetical protein